MVTSRLLHRCCVCTSFVISMNSWGRDISYTVLQWVPKCSYHKWTEYLSSPQRVFYCAEGSSAGSLLPKSLVLECLDERGGGEETCKRNSNAQVKVRFRTINYKVNIFKNESALLPWGSPLFILTLLGLSLWAYTSGLPVV